MSFRRVHFITGATGFIGRHLLRRLLAFEDDIIYVLIRPLADTSAQTRFKELFPEIPYNRVRFIESDLRGLSVEQCLEQLKVNGTILHIWHLAANLSFRKHDKARVLSDNFDGTKKIVELANRAQGILHYMSTAYVCGDAKGVLKEDCLKTSVRHRNAYEHSKYIAEEFVRDYCQTKYIIYRPSIVIGDAYQGKAEGCSFGYYRFAFMFYTFKKWLLYKQQNGSQTTRKLLALLKIRFSSGTNHLLAPWLVFPFPGGGAVDMVPVDYVTEVMIQTLNRQNLFGKTFHLTNPHPPDFRFILLSVLDDLGYKEIKFIKIPPGLYSLLLKILHHTFFPLRIKTRSAMWYLPYITRTYEFSRQNIITAGLPDADPISRHFLEKINTYAQSHIFCQSQLFEN